MKSYQEAIFGTFQGKDIVAYTFENDLGYRLKVMTYVRCDCLRVCHSGQKS